jgi:hypothetical protein
MCTAGVVRLPLTRLFEDVDPFLLSVDTVKKSIETITERWLARNVGHVWEGGRGWRASSRDTVR